MGRVGAGGRLRRAARSSPLWKGGIEPVWEGSEHGDGMWRNAYSVMGAVGNSRGPSLDSAGGWEEAA